jgi:hypothetical protein
MDVLLYLPTGRTLTVTGVTAVERQRAAIVCRQGDAVLAAFSLDEILAYALVPDPAVVAAVGA